MLALMGGRKIVVLLGFVLFLTQGSCVMSCSTLFSQGQCVVILLLAVWGFNSLVRPSVF